MSYPDLEESSCSEKPNIIFPLEQKMVSRVFSICLTRLLSMVGLSLNKQHLYNWNWNRRLLLPVSRSKYFRDGEGSSHLNGEHDFLLCWKVVSDEFGFSHELLSNIWLCWATFSPTLSRVYIICTFLKVVLIKTFLPPTLYLSLLSH